MYYKNYSGVVCIFSEVSVIPSWGLSLISYYTTFQELVGKIPESRKDVIISGTH